MATGIVLMRVDPVTTDEDGKKRRGTAAAAKRFVATFVAHLPSPHGRNDGKGKGPTRSRSCRTVRFGAAGGSTYIDHGDDRLRRNYLARHGAPASRENWDDPYTPGALSRWILWGEHPSLEAATDAYRARFGFGYLPPPQ